MTMVGVIVVLVTVDVFLTASGQVVVCNYDNGWINCCISDSRFVCDRQWSWLVVMKMAEVIVLLVTVDVLVNVSGGGL